MGLILRWFYSGGRRYHAFLQASRTGPLYAQELVIRSAGFSTVVDVPIDTCLEQLSDETLIGLVQRARPVRIMRRQEAGQAV